MAKKARQRISYVLELAGSQSGGHRLGVNGLAVDRDNAILYSGGRDGVVCAWDLNLDLKEPNGTAPKPKSSTKFRAQTQAHTHWINDIVLAQNNTALVSASSDLLVKVWRPHGNCNEEPATIGQHADYVKCLATPSQQTPWVASGGLDRKICLWDLAGAGKTLEIDVSGEEMTEKGSVYALSVNHSIMASGGPESTVRLWDPRTGKNITKFVGHTDNVRAILVNDAGDTVMTASSDQTVKVWSVTAGRCMHTLTMHNDSVWSLYSESPDLGVFYSSDRSGLVVKTDVRGTMDEMDDGLSLAIAQENDGVLKVVSSGGYIWTATSSSSINRWADVDTGAEIQLPEAFRQQRASIGGAAGFPSSRSREVSVVSSTAAPATAATAATAAAAAAAPAAPTPAAAPGTATSTKHPVIPAKSILRISNTASFPNIANSDATTMTGVTSTTARKGSEILPDTSFQTVEPIHQLPEETIEGQFGLVKHKLLHDRRRVLTLDTAGDVLMWDLIRCKPIRKFGKKHLEDVEKEVNTREAVAPWCSIDTSSGNLTVVLEPFNCFDAEMYADELVLEEPVEFREDQRINLGKWILRYLFAKLIDEEIRRDEAYRAKLNEAVGRRIAASSARANPPSSIAIPPPPGMAGWEQNESPGTTPRANGNSYHPPFTPGMGIGIATPGPVPPLPGSFGDVATPGSPFDTSAARSPLAGRQSVEREDYFSNAISSADVGNSGGQIGGRPPMTPATEVPPSGSSAAAAAEKEAKSPTAENGKEKDKEKDKETARTPGTPFGKKFRMGMSFGSRKLSRSASSTAPEKPAVVDEKVEERSESSSSHEKEVDDCLLGVVQKVRNEYDKDLAEAPDKLVETRLAPSLPTDTPVLKLPPGTKVIIQEETSGGSAELYRGTVETVGQDADVIEQRGPMWLGEVLLVNRIPAKDPVKVSFVLHPWRDSLPSIATPDGNNRLNANRMLRVKKILAYVAEKIDPPPEVPEGADPAEPDPDALRPEEYLELYCNDQLLPITMSLATLRAHVWKGGNDIVLYYKANGRKEIPVRPPPSQEQGGLQQHEQHQNQHQHQQSEVSEEGGGGVEEAEEASAAAAGPQSVAVSA